MWNHWIVRIGEAVYKEYLMSENDYFRSNHLYFIVKGSAQIQSKINEE